MLLLQCGLESAKTERHRGLDEQLLLLVPLRGPNVGGQCSSCRFASPPPARAPAHFRFRTRARTAAATGRLRTFGHLKRGYPPKKWGGKTRKPRKSVPSLPPFQEGSHTYAFVDCLFTIIVVTIGFSAYICYGSGRGIGP